MDLTNCKRIVDVYAELVGASKKLEQYEGLLECAHHKPTDLMVYCNVGGRIERVELPHQCIAAGMRELLSSQRAVVRRIQARLEEM